MQDFQVFDDWHKVTWRSPGVAAIYVLEQIQYERSVRTWCKKHIGEDGWFVTLNDVWFADPVHATAFALKWI